VARSRGPAQPERVAHEGGRALQFHLERDVRRRVARKGLAQWLADGRIDHDTSHARPFEERTLGDDLRRAALHGAALGANCARGRRSWASSTKAAWGCTRDHPRPPAARDGHLQERLSQSALYAAMREVSDETAAHHYAWLRQRA